MRQRLLRCFLVLAAGSAVCMITGAPTFRGGGSGASSSPWKYNTDKTLMLQDSTVGDTDYTSDLVFGSDVLDYSTADKASRFWFSKSKAAFRAGYCGSTYWDVANVGLYSTAFGQNCKASGESSFAAGGTSAATGPASVALGGSNTATGTGAVVLGYASQATANRTVALGSYALAYQTGQLAFAGAGFDSNSGTAQATMFVPLISTSVTYETPLTLFGTVGGGRMVVPAKTSWAFTAMVLGETANAETVVAYKLEGVISRNASNTTRIVGSVVTTVLAEDTDLPNPTATADDTNEALIINVTGDGRTWRFAATVHITEVQY